MDRRTVGHWAAGVYLASWVVTAVMLTRGAGVFASLLPPLAAGACCHMWLLWDGIRRLRRER